MNTSSLPPGVLFPGVIVGLLVTALLPPPLHPQTHPNPPFPFQPDAEAIDLLSGPAFLSTERGRSLVDEARRRISPPPGPEGEVPGMPEGLTALVTGPLFTSQVVNDFNQDVEPAILSLTLANSTIRTATTWIKQTSDPNPVAGGGRFRNQFASTTDFTTWSPGQLPIPTGYTQSADPLMDANGFNDGVKPLRMYTTGIIYQDRSCGFTPNSIGLWHSDNAGLSWSSPALVDTSTSTSIFLDKPDVAVSWWSGSRGWVYVAYLRYACSNPNNSQLVVRRSTDGGSTFGAASTVTTGNVQGAQLAVNPFNGTVYLVWVDFNLNAIRMSFASSSAASWSTPETAATGNLVGPSSAFLGNVRALTLPMVRYNWVASRLSVVWHEFESSTSSRTDIFYTARTTSGWLAKQRVNSVRTNDQFMPSLDFDNNGNQLVMFYDRAPDSRNEFYKESWACITPAGGSLGSGTLTMPLSNPDQHGNMFIGDYQDNWYWGFADTWGDRFNGAYIQQQSIFGGRSNPYVSGVSCQ